MRRMVDWARCRVDWARWKQQGYCAYIVRGVVDARARFEKMVVKG